MGALSSITLTQFLTGAAIATSIGGHIFGGISASQAAEEEADLIRQESLIEANRLEREHRKFLAKQSVMFLKGGVTLSGSPLFVLEETREEKKTQVDAEIRSGRARANIVSNAGRARMIGGFAGAVGSGTSMFLQAKAAKIF